MQTLSHLVLINVLTMSLLTSLMLSIILNLSLSVYPISPHVPLSLYSYIFFCSPRALQHMLPLLACSVIRFLQSRFVPPLAAVPLHFGHHSIVPSIVSKYLTPLLFSLFYYSACEWKAEPQKPCCFFAEILHLICFALRYSSQSGSLILCCSFFLTLSLYFLSFSAPLMTDGLSTLSSWLPHRSELTTNCSKGRAKNITHISAPSLQLSSLSSFLFLTFFSSTSSYTFTDIWHVCPWP